MALRHPNLPKASLHGKELWIEGETEPYLRQPGETIWLRVDGLRIRRGYELEDPVNRTGDMVPIEFLIGNASLEESNRIGIAGRNVNTNMPIEFQLRLVAEAETNFHWHITIGFHLDEQSAARDRFWIIARCTRQHFDDVLAAVRRGHVDSIRVGIATTMWMRSERSTVSVPRTWYLVPHTDRETIHPKLEQGKISSLVWEERPDARPSHAAADGTTLPKPRLALLRTLVYSIVGIWLAVGAVLVILVLLRR